MPHVREQLRQAIAAQLAGLPTAGARVYEDRDTAGAPLQAAELPALLVEDDEEDVESETLGAGTRLQRRRLQLRVTACSKRASGYRAELNALALEVEGALAAFTAGGLAAFIRYAGRDPVEVDAGTDLPVARAALRFEVVYRTAAGTPDIAA